MLNDWITHIGALFYPLLGLSMLGGILIIERLFLFIRLPTPQRDPALHSILAELDQHKTHPKTIRDEIASYRLQDVQTHLERGLNFLRLISVLSPMVGLLGTVIGMIHAFQDIAAHTGPVSPDMIAQGLWSAMLTTAYGLIIALPCLLTAFLYTRLAEKRIYAFQRQLNAHTLALEGANLSS